MNGVAFLDMSEEDGDEEPARAERKLKKKKPRAGVDDFPLPPSHNQMQVPDTQHSASTTTLVSSSGSHNLQVPSGADIDMSPESPLRASYLTPEPKPSGSFASSQSVFRPLRLVHDDLKYTRINVLYSSIKANDKGKEVISFVVEVDPGNNKEPWKVEKLYSDVLNLDQRVRSSSSRSVQKKMAHLPESKMWKDHAPAKVDQRRVRVACRLLSLCANILRN